MNLKLFTFATIGILGIYFSWGNDQRMDGLIGAAINGAVLFALLAVAFRLRVMWLIRQKKKAIEAEVKKREQLGY